MNRDTRTFLVGCFITVVYTYLLVNISHQIKMDTYEWSFSNIITMIFDMVMLFFGIQKVEKTID